MSRFWCFLCALVVFTLGCRRDMQVQPKYTPLSRSWFYPDGRSARPIPAGTVAIDEVNLDPAVATGTVDNKFVNTIPIRVDADLLARGQQRFDIYCSPCHGRTGYGDGMIATRGFEHPANLNSDRVRNAPPGYIYQVIVNGYGAMEGYAYQIQSARDRWAIIAYIRALELSRRTTIDDAPAQEKAELGRQR